PSLALARDPGPSGSFRVEATLPMPLGGIQFAIRYDPTALEVEEVVLDGSLTSFQLEHGAARPGEIAVLVYSPDGEPLPAGASPLLRVAARPRQTSAGAAPALELADLRTATPEGRAVQLTGSV